MDNPNKTRPVSNRYKECGTGLFPVQNNLGKFSYKCCKGYIDFFGPFLYCSLTFITTVYIE